MIYSFDVSVSDHDALCRGVLALKLRGAQHDYHRIVIEAETYEDASLAAAQMASCQGMVTEVLPRI